MARSYFWSALNEKPNRLGAVRSLGWLRGNAVRNHGEGARSIVPISLESDPQALESFSIRFRFHDCGSDIAPVP